MSDERVKFETIINLGMGHIKRFYGDKISDIRLEEIHSPSDETAGRWYVTIGFLYPDRKPDPGKNALRALMIARGEEPMERLYKRLIFDQYGEFLEMENRLVP